MFRFVAMFVAVVCLVLFFLLLGWPGSYTATYGVDGDTGASFMARRASPMFLGLAVMLWMVRDAGAGPSRRAIGLGVAITFVGIAATGLFEYARGVANPAIVVAAVAEVLIAAAFWRTA